MLDKTVPFHSIIMKREYSKPSAKITLPAGYKARTYQKGDEIAWAEIETQVLEFENTDQALQCHSYYLSQLDELKERQWFIEAPNGKPVATATAWYTQTEKGRIPVVHALGCLPEYQGKGLGRAAAIKMLESFYRLDKHADVWLDTQTWSYRAIGIYLSLGFIPMKTATYNETPNEFNEALPILHSKMKCEIYNTFLQTAQ